MDTKEYLNILKTEVNNKRIKKDTTQILHEGATEAQAKAKVAEYRRELIKKLESLAAHVPKDQPTSNINNLLKNPKVAGILKDFDKAVPKTIKWLMKHGIPK